MAVIIDMDKPKCCSECKEKFLDMGIIMKCGVFYKDCPLKEVKECKAEYYISRKQLIHEIINQECEVKGNTEWLNGHAKHQEQILELISKMPSVYLKSDNSVLKDIKSEIIHSIAKQYSEHNEVVPVWLSIGEINGKEN